jgi:hypothetical protein
MDSAICEPLVDGPFKRRTCRLFASVALGLLAHASTGCTVLGYAIGNATIPTPESIPAQSARSIPQGTEVEVFYLPRANECAPLAGATSLDAPPGSREVEFSVATGEYGGIEGDMLVLNHLVARAAAVSHEAFDSSTSASFDTVRIVVPLRQVSLIRTKPSSAPAVIGTVIGVAADVAAVVLWARAVRHVE